MCLRVMHNPRIEEHSKQCVQQWVLIQVSTPSELFSWIFFQLFLPFATIYYDSHNLKNCLECVSPITSRHLLRVYVPGDAGVAQKNFLRFFLRKAIEKILLFGKIFCFQIRISLLNTLVVNSWTLGDLRPHFRKSGWLSLTFEMTNFFAAKFCSKSGWLP